MVDLIFSLPWWSYPLMLIGLIVVLFTFMIITDIDVIDVGFSVIGNIIIFPVMLWVLLILVCRRMLNKHKTEFYIIPFSKFYIILFRKVFKIELEQKIDICTTENIFGAKSKHYSETTYTEW